MRSNDSIGKRRKLDQSVMLVPEVELKRALFIRTLMYEKTFIQTSLNPKGPEPLGGWGIDCPTDRSG